MPRRLRVRLARPTSSTPRPSSKRSVRAPVSAAEMDVFYAHLNEVMSEADFHDRTGQGHLMTRIRRIFNRTGIDENELNILRGILTAVQGRRRAAGSKRKVS